MQKQKSKKAFSLVELSIVLMVIGLLIGMVMGASDLNHQAKIRNFLSKFRNYQTAMELFEAKYEYLPGDIPNAQTMFGSSDCPDHGSKAALDCNGDGNRVIGSYSSFTDDGNPNEHVYAYLHMRLAGIISGNFAPEDSSDSTDYAISDLNTPSFNVDGVKGYYAFWGPNLHNSSNNRYNFNINARTPNSDSSNKTKPDHPAFRGTTAGIIDRKIDDGISGTGRLTASDGTGPSGCSYLVTTIICKVVYQGEAN